MEPLNLHTCQCPYCGEMIELLVDISGGDQHYIEDCPVCCRPLFCTLNVDADGHNWLHLSREDD